MLKFAQLSAIPIRGEDKEQIVFILTLLNPTLVVFVFIHRVVVMTKFADDFSDGCLSITGKAVIIYYILSTMNGMVLCY